MPIGIPFYCKRCFVVSRGVNVENLTKTVSSHRFVKYLNNEYDELILIDNILTVILFKTSTGPAVLP